MQPMPPMPPMPAMRRTWGGTRTGRGNKGGNGMSAMPPMPSLKPKRVEEWMEPDGMDANRTGSGTRAMRAALAIELGLGPMKAIEPGKRDPDDPGNVITPTSRPNITKSSRDQRDINYSGGMAAIRMAAILKAAKEGGRE